VGPAPIAKTESLTALVEPEDHVPRDVHSAAIFSKAEGEPAPAEGDVPAAVEAPTASEQHGDPDRESSDQQDDEPVGEPDGGGDQNGDDHHSDSNGGHDDHHNEQNQHHDEHEGWRG
jgi:hypothetical protein